MPESEKFILPYPTREICQHLKKLLDNYPFEIIIPESLILSVEPEWFNQISEHDGFTIADHDSSFASAKLLLLDFTELFESSNILENTIELIKKLQTSGQLEAILLYSPSDQSITENLLNTDIPSESAMKIKFLISSEKGLLIELTRLDRTSEDCLKTVTGIFESSEVPFLLLENDFPGGGLERVRVPLETEAWRLIRETGSQPALVDYISKTSMGMKSGILTSSLANDPDKRSSVNISLVESTYGDSRFYTPAGTIPPDRGGKYWNYLNSAVEPINVSAGDKKSCEKILIAGAPQLVKSWAGIIRNQAKKKPEIVEWPLWEISSLRENLQEYLNNGKYDLVIECLIAPVEERQVLLNNLLGSINSNGQVWVHTLNVPSTITVQVLPQEISSVGFGGIPPLFDKPVIEFAKPFSSNRNDLKKAASMAKKLGFEAYEVTDEPGGIGARLLSLLVNATLFVYREGIVSSPTEIDRAVKQLLGLKTSPLQMADIIGLDVIEAVLVGLNVFTGETRYRTCPLLIQRIEAGIIGNSTGKGFYTA